MGLFDFIFGKKPTEKEITAYNYSLFFDYIPKRLHDWVNNKCSFQSVLSFDGLIEKNKVWNKLINDTKITDSTLKKCNDITLYLIQAPSNKMMGEVASAIIAVNPKIRKFEYYTMEYSIGGFAICTADETGNHYYMDDCKDGEQFGAYVIKQAMETLMPAPTPKPKTASAFQSKSTSKPASTPTTEKKHTSESFLKTLEKIADQYYKERGVVSLEDWLVTKKVGDEFKFYITQYPDEEFGDPNCEVTLMVDFMDHNGRMEVVNKFFPQKENKTQSDTKQVYPSAKKDSYYQLEQLRQILMGELRLQPIDAGIIFNEQQREVIAQFAKVSPRIKKFLPNLDLSSSEAIAKYFSIYCQKTEMGLEFGYAIKMNKYGDVGTIGFIFVHTPTLNELSINFPQWTIDFCLFEPMEGKAIMTTSILRVLDTLKNSFKVNDVFAIVDEDNAKCLALMEKLPFDATSETLTDPSNGHKALLFHCPLHQINFQRR